MTSVSVAEVGADFVSLVWQSPDGAVELYEVSYWMVDSDRNISHVYSFYTNITLGSLRQQSVYMFRVCKTTTTTSSFTDIVLLPSKSLFIRYNVHLTIHRGLWRMSDDVPNIRPDVIEISSEVLYCTASELSRAYNDEQTDKQTCTILVVTS